MSFTHQIETLSGQNVHLCIQCSKCSAGCPFADRMDMMPAQVIHRTMLGHADRILNSTAIWYCAGCETCSTRCPQGLEPAAVMNAARLLAIQNGITPSVPAVAAFYQSFVENMMMYGRVSDLMLVVALRLKSRDMFSEIPLAIKLFERGKLNPLALPAGVVDFRRLYERVQVVEKRTA